MMETRRLTNSEIDIAAQMIKDGQLVSFPTETVYGLGASALNQDAVKKVYKAKGRPSDNPLIVHLSQGSDVYQYIGDYSNYLDKIIDAFWPGPLTIVLKLKDNTFSKDVTGGLNTCAFRVPNNKLAQELIQKTGPLVAPSANTSGKPSPTMAKHVLEDLNGKISAVIDGGSAKVGVESTVIDLTVDNQITILRPGGIGKEDLVNLLPEVNVCLDNHLIKEAETPKAPGMKYKHYSPNTKILMLGLDDDLPQALINYDGIKIGLLANDQLINQVKNYIFDYYSLGNKSDSQKAAAQLFAGMRYLDGKVDLILAETLKGDDKYSKAYMNRLQKATGGEYFEK